MEQEDIRLLLSEGKTGEAFRALLENLIQQPLSRASYVRVAQFEYDRQNWTGAIYWLRYALLIPGNKAQDRELFDLMTASMMRLDMTEQARNFMGKK